MAEISEIGGNPIRDTTAYHKPSTGIPKTDLASAVQTSLGKADTALQSVTENNLTLHSGSGDSPSLIFSRGTATDSYTDYIITDKGGSLYFENRAGENPRSKFRIGDNTAPSWFDVAPTVGSNATAVSLTGHKHAKADITDFPTIPSKVSQLTNDSGFTSNTGTVTSVAVKMNGTTKGTVTGSGTIDLGTVITSHQDISGKLDKYSTAFTDRDNKVYGIARDGSQVILGAYGPGGTDPFSLPNGTVPLIWNNTLSCNIPVHPYNCAPKKYVDDALSGKQGILRKHTIGFTINDGDSLTIYYTLTVLSTRSTPYTDLTQLESNSSEVRAVIETDGYTIANGRERVLAYEMYYDESDDADILHIWSVSGFSNYLRYASWSQNWWDIREFYDYMETLN